MKLHTLSFIFALLAAVPSAFSQGSLTPPGAPAPTMKTLQQIEPRIDLNELEGDANAVCVIKGPGSYYLTRDLAGAAGKDTIRVTPNLSPGRLTIDLNGFALTTTGGGRNAVALVAGNDGVVIRNGIIIANGGGTTKAIGGADAHVVCEDLTIAGGGSELLDLGTDAVVTRCRLSQGGIRCAERSVVRDTLVNGAGTDVNITLRDDSQAVGVIFSTGRGQFAVGARSLIADCQVNAAGPPTIFSNGAVLVAGAGSVIRHCSVAAGTIAGNAVFMGEAGLISGCRVTAAFRDGIGSGAGANITVEECVVEGNGRNGIVLGPNARVRDCTVQGSGTAGIEVGENSVITGCNVSACRRGGILSSAENVSIHHCALKGNSGGPGISLLSGTVADCDIAGTVGGAGIEVTQRSFVLRNRSENNGTISPADPRAGLRVIGPNNRLEGNQLINNAGFGLEITSSVAPNVNTGNLTMGNHARGNAAGQFSISANNATGPVVTTANMATVTNPTANFGP